MELSREVDEDDGFGLLGVVELDDEEEDVGEERVVSTGEDVDDVISVEKVAEVGVDEMDGVDDVDEEGLVVDDEVEEEPKGHNLMILIKLPN